MSKEYKELIVGLDIGTSKITCVVAELKPDGRMEVVGLGSQPSSGLKKGSWSTSRPPWMPSAGSSRKSS
jgi:cell division protein FtsA